MADQYIKEIMTPDGLRKLRASALTPEAMNSVTNIFIAEYNVTSFDDIKTAYDAGKLVLATKVDEGNQYRMEWYVLSNYYENEDYPNFRQFVFTNLYGDYEKSISRFPGNWHYEGYRRFARFDSVQDLKESIATDFDSLSFPAPAGTLCMYNYSLYKANTTVSSDTWDDTQWDEVTVEEVMGNAVYVTPFETPYDDIQSAYDAGKTVLASWGDSIYALSEYNLSQHIFYFSRLAGYTWMQLKCWKDQYPATNDWDTTLGIVSMAEQSQIAPVYSNASTYEVGDLVYNGGLFRCIAAISTPENWNPSHWTQTTIAAELKRVESYNKLVVFEVNQGQGIQHPTFNDVNQAVESGKVPMLHVVNYNGASDSPADYFHVVNYSSAPNYHSYSFSNGKEVKTVNSSNVWSSASAYDSALNEYSINAVQNATLYAIINDLQTRVTALEGN